jgi:hypothetical protein
MVNKLDSYVNFAEGITKCHNLVQVRVLVALLTTGRVFLLFQHADPSIS